MLIFKSLPRSKYVDKQDSCEEICYSLSKEKVDQLCIKFKKKPMDVIALVWGILTAKFDRGNTAAFLIKKESSYHYIQLNLNGMLICDAIKDMLCNDCTVEDFTEMEGIPDILFFDKEHEDMESKNIKGNYVKVSDIEEKVHISYRVLKGNLDSNIKKNVKIYLNQIFDQISTVSNFDDIHLLCESDIMYIKKFNENEGSYSIETALPILIQNQCSRCPENIAVYFENVGYTYKDINEKTNALAWKLLSIGIEKGDYVPVMMNRCVELVISIYAVMKTGGIFIPVDMSWPVTRINEVLQACKSRIVLTEKNCKKEISGKILEVDYLQLERREDPLIEVNVEDSIYAIFTSGSTGVPKGAINTHKGIVNRFMYMNKRYHIKPEDTILLTANHAFDSAVWQMFWPLINGNATVIPSSGERFDIVQIINLIEEYHVTITDFVPSVFHLLVDFIKIKKNMIPKLYSLRQLLIGGEEMLPKYIYEFKSMFPRCSITNTYGPAEASIGTIFYELPDQVIDIIPIGTPIDNVKAYIMDDRERLLPVGASGNLYLGGVCVGGGYVNQEELTKASFKYLDIYNDGVLHYVYKTGDLARINDEKQIDFFGRADSQVKINGVRIELQEVSKVISDMDGVNTSHVVCHKVNGKNVLCAYYVSEKNIKEDSIREWIVKKLPKGMLPSYIVKIDQMPITLNGKMDIKKLPLPYM